MDETVESYYALRAFVFEATLNQSLFGDEDDFDTAISRAQVALLNFDRRTLQ